jgi:hypothetical protein
MAAEARHLVAAEWLMEDFIGGLAWGRLAWGNLVHDLPHFMAI